MANSSYQKWSNNDTDQTPKDVRLIDNLDGTYSIDVSTGIISGGGVPRDVSRTLRIEGRNSDINKTGDWVDIWEGPTDIIPEPNPAGETLVIKGTNVNDTLLGTGAQVVRVEYLNSLDELTFIDVPMEGVATIVTAITNLTDVIDFYAIQTGTANTPIGNIEIINLADTIVYSIILTGGNKSQSSLRHLLPSSTFYLTGMLVSSTSKGIEVALRSTSNDSGEVFPNVYLYQVPLTVSDSPVWIPFNPAIEIPANSRMKVSAKTTLSGTHSVSVWINGWVKI